MTEQQFQTQLNRLTENFGKTAYGTERARLIWREVQHFDAHWFANQVDEWIGNLRQAPLLEEIRKACSIERERAREREKKQHAQEAEDWMSGQVFDDEIKREICQMINKRMMKLVDDDTWNKFVPGIHKLAGGKG